MRQWAGRVASAAVVAILVLATGCGTFFIYQGNLPAGSTTSDYVYVANATAGTLAAYAIGTNTLTVVPGSPINLGFTPNAVAINPANTILFVSGTSGTSGILATYSIASNGALTLLRTITLQTTTLQPAAESAIAVSPDGNW